MAAAPATSPKPFLYRVRQHLTSIHLIRDSNMVKEALN